LFYYNKKQKYSKIIQQNIILLWLSITIKNEIGYRLKNVWLTYPNWNRGNFLETTLTITPVTKDLKTNIFEIRKNHFVIG